jgi:adenylate cyclase
MRVRKILRRLPPGGLFTTGRASGLIALLLLLVLRGADPDFLQTMRVRTFDGFQMMQPRPIPEEEPVTIVDLDDASLEEFGQWPWPRTLLADLVDRLTELGAVVIGIDIVFAEPDRLSPAVVAQTLPGLDPPTRDHLSTLPSNDALFAESLRHSRVVLGEAGIPGPATRPTRDIPPAPTIVRIGGDPRPLIPHVDRILRNVPELDFAASGWGVFSVNQEADGVVRRVPAVVTDGEAVYPSLALEMLRIFTANENVGIKANPDGLVGVIVRPNLVQTDGQGRIWIYPSHHDPAKYVSAADLLKGRVDPAKIGGKLILVGTSAASLGDVKSSAVDRIIPGVELHAQMIETILFNQQLENPGNADGVEMCAAILGGLLMILMVPAIGARWTLALFLSAAAALVGASWYRFVHDRLLYDPVFPVASTLLTFILVTYASYAREEARKKQVRGAFSRYLSPSMVERLVSEPDLLRLGGETRDMTMLFCDVRGFTTISEQFDAQGLTHLINRFLTPMTDVILAHQGTIDKYMGDCIMAFWNAPLIDPDHAIHACRAALAMNEALGPINDALAAEAAAENRQHIPLLIGIGLNSGPVVVGNMGSDQRFDYSVLGDPVNLASRLEGQSKTYGVTIVIGENSRKQAEDFACLPLDRIRVKGKSQAVEIFALLGDAALADNPEFRALLTEHDRMLTAYRAQDWTTSLDAIKFCRELGMAWSLDRLYDLYAERIADYQVTQPPAVWDGVFVATSK